MDTIGQSGSENRPKTGKEDAPANANLEFLLVAYCNPAAVPGDRPTFESADRSMSGMLRRAKWDAFSMGAGLPQVWEEGLAEAMARIGASNIAASYRPNPFGVAPWANTVIRRSVRDVALDRQFNAHAEVPEGARSRTPGPATLAELRELLDLFGPADAGPTDAVVSRQGARTSAEYVRRHRRRKKAFLAIAGHFDGLTFRPLKRKSQVAQR